MADLVIFSFWQSRKFVVDCCQIDSVLVIEWHRQSGTVSGDRGNHVTLGQGGACFGDIDPGVFDRQGASGSQVDAGLLEVSQIYFTEGRLYQRLFIARLPFDGSYSKLFGGGIIFCALKMRDLTTYI